MSRFNVHLLDLSDEILLIILKKLDNIDVLYSLLNINNQRLNNLVQEKTFSNILNFVSTDDISSIDRCKLDRFCIDILPKIHNNVKCFILEPVSMERILRAADYPNLTELRLFNFKEEIALSYLINESPFQYIFQQQITDIILMRNDNVKRIDPTKNYTRNVYARILDFFKNLKRLSINQAFISSHRVLSLHDLPSDTFFSSTLTHLCINVANFDDCLYLLDGRLKQLTTLIVRAFAMVNYSSITQNMDDLPNLKCFSFKCYVQIDQYDHKVLPLLRRMLFLEKLTLYLRIKNRGTFVDSTHLENEILGYMPRLHSFTFYICTYEDTVASFRYVPNQDIRKIVTCAGYERMASIINYINNQEAVCSIFSIPFAFDRLRGIGNIFPNIVFNYVTYLLVQDVVPFNHEFFIRVAQSFPLLQDFHVANLESQSSCNISGFSSNHTQLYSIAEYPHLTSLDVRSGSIDYVEQFLNETKTCVPCLTELTVSYNYLRIVTKDFTGEETRRNCAKVKRLDVIGTWVYSKDFYVYFPLL